MPRDGDEHRPRTRLQKGNNNAALILHVKPQTMLMLLRLLLLVLPLLLLLQLRSGGVVTTHATRYYASRARAFHSRHPTAAAQWPTVFCSSRYPYS